MRLSTSFFAVLSITAVGAIQACSDDSDDKGSSGGSGGSSAGASQGGGTMPSAGTSNQAGMGTPSAGSGGRGGAGAAGAPGGGTAAVGGTAGADTGRGGAGAGAAGAPNGGKAGSAGGGAGGASAGAGAGGTAAGTGGATTGGSGGGASKMNFFVTSDTAKTGNLGGLAKADERCQSLAKAVGAGDKTWKAYLSAEDPMTNAKDRIGPGPYYNAKGALLAMTKDELHARKGDADLFLDEKGNKINGQWAGSPTPNEHDILTGTNTDGTVAVGKTCKSWTSESNSDIRFVGHSDGLGPGMKTDMHYPYWNGSHDGKCDSTQPGGGAGRTYCFVGP
jgi:hypothetical protein